MIKHVAPIDSRRHGCIPLRATFSSSTPPFVDNRPAPRQLSSRKKNAAPASTAAASGETTVKFGTCNFAEVIHQHRRSKPNDFPPGNIKKSLQLGGVCNPHHARFAPAPWSKNPPPAFDEKSGLSRLILPVCRGITKIGHHTAVMRRATRVSSRHSIISSTLQQNARPHRTAHVACINKYIRAAHVFPPEIWTVTLAVRKANHLRLAAAASQETWQTSSAHARSPCLPENLELLRPKRGRWLSDPSSRFSTAASSFSNLLQPCRRRSLSSHGLSWAPGPF